MVVSIGVRMVVLHISASYSFTRVRCYSGFTIPVVWIGTNIPAIIMGKGLHYLDNTNLAEIGPHGYQTPCKNLRASNDICCADHDVFHAAIH